MHLGRRNNLMKGFADLIDNNARELLDDTVSPALTAETIVGGIYEVVYGRVLRGAIKELPQLLPDLTYSALLPYLGPEAAAAERLRLLEGVQAA